tara:strand:+ start:46 stop:480 length:435 start_codon:yes stop_codon:yes gene_type:complete
METSIYFMNFYIKNNSNRNDNEKTTLFNSDKIPNISTKDYLTRIYKYTNSSYEISIITYILLNKINKSFIKINSFNIHRILCTLILIVIKYYSDHYYDNAYYSKIAGITLQELNKLEITLLKKMDFRLYISLEEFKYIENQIFS